MRCKGWRQEAALRMLENNLHPDVAERPEDLVVYGGIGKAARDPEALAAIKRELQAARGRRDAARAVGQAGRRVRDPHRRAARADRQLQPRAAVGDVGQVPRARRRRADDVRADDRGVLDLHRDPGHPAGHVRDVRRGRAQALRRHAAREARRDRRARRHGRRPAAGGDDERAACALCVEVDLHRIERRIETAYLDERAASLDDALERLEAAQAEGRALSIGLLGNAAEVLPELVAARRGDRRRDRPDERARPAQRLRPRRADRRAGRGAARAATPTSTCAASARARSSTSPRCATCRRAGAEAFDYGNALRGLAAEHGDDDAFAYPGFVPGLHPAAVLRGQGPVPLGRAVGRSGGHRGHRRRDPRPVRRAGPHPPLDRARARAGAVPGAPGADLLARLRRAPPGRRAVQRAGGVGRA